MEHWVLWHVAGHFDVMTAGVCGCVSRMFHHIVRLRRQAILDNTGHQFRAHLRVCLYNRMLEIIRAHEGDALVVADWGPGISDWAFWDLCAGERRRLYFGHPRQCMQPLEQWKVLDHILGTGGTLHIHPIHPINSTCTFGWDRVLQQELWATRHRWRAVIAWATDSPDVK